MFDPVEPSARCSYNKRMAGEREVTHQYTADMGRATGSLVLLMVSMLSSARAQLPMTDGFTAVELAEEQFKVQKPYDVPLAERYELVDGVRRMWVYAADKPISSDHPGGPRTEIKIQATHNKFNWLINNPLLFFPMI